ncbi:16975_t:CDS:2 [Dentiscutata heterogama]|uniref:16975_t:CDS:1 n=1 Tax=Dentiscutata heterogama TaxID=1316150 RepID=A0ACA9LWJ7_9GLOM|nr:16975_t:CDS:2 [Dentiscutata heterogama]
MSKVFALANRIYTNSYNSRPLLTSACTNAIIASISDILAQGITLAKKNNNHTSATKPESSITTKSLSNFNEETLSKQVQKQVSANIEGSNLSDETLPTQVQKQVSANIEGFDYIRTLRFSSYGFVIAPVVYTWFSFLDKRFPLPQIKASKATQISTIIKRVSVDQIAFAPVGLSLFFIIIGVFEGHDINGIKQKFREAYIPALKANYITWPFVQFINFGFLPLRYRLPFVSSVGILWTCYLSLLNSVTEF